MTKHLCTWFDINVTDMDKAAAFYQKVLQRELKVQNQNGTTVAVFDHKHGEEIGGSLVLNSKHKAESVSTGPLLYFSVEGRLDAAVKEVPNCGGKVVSGVEEIAPWGFRAVVTDCCGNRIALHTYKK